MSGEHDSVKQEPAKTPRSGVVGIPVVYGREDVKSSVRLLISGLAVDITGEHGTVAAVRAVDLDVGAGCVHAVIGESGSGKSTVLRAISGALPPTAHARGRIELSGGGVPGGHADILGPARRRRSMLPPTPTLAGRVIGVIPQSAATALTPVRTFGAQLTETCAALGHRRDVGELITAVGLRSGDAGLYPHEMSGGMAQRAAFALALAGDPPLLLADEPTSALDPVLTAHLLAILRDHADAGGTVLLVTHDIEELESTRIAEEVSVMRHGRIVETGTATQVLRSPAHAYTRLLLAALPSRGLHAPATLHAPGALHDPGDTDGTVR